MAKLTVLLVCLTIIYSCSALKCYHCDKQTCEVEQSKWQTTICGNQNAACQKQAFTDSNGKMWTSRKCIDKTVPCSAPQGTKEVSCDSCTSDLCNSAPNTYGQYALVLSIVAYLVPKVFLH